MDPLSRFEDRPHKTETVFDVIVDVHQTCTRSPEENNFNFFIAVARIFFILNSL